MTPEELTPELREKAKACKTPEELFELAKSEGIELSEDELDAINGGGIIDWDCLMDLGFLDSEKPNKHKHHPHKHGK